MQFRKHPTFRIERDQEILQDSIKIAIPPLYSNKLLVKELASNLKNHSKTDKESAIEISVSKNNSSFVQSINLEIVSIISQNEYSNSSGEGVKCIELMSNASIFGFKYTAKKVENGKYKQILSFKY